MATSTPTAPDPASSDTAATWWQQLTSWWAEFSLQTKLLAIATLVVSLMMTGITFFALNGIQRDAVMNDTRYARDLGLLLGGNVSVQGVESGQGEGGRLAVSPAPLNLRAANVACGGRGCGSQAYSCCCEFGLFTHPHSPGGDRRVV